MGKGLRGGGEEGGGAGGGWGGLAANRYGTISTPWTCMLCPRSCMIHAASLDAPMHRVSFGPSVQMSMIVGCFSAVMYLCDSITA